MWRWIINVTWLLWSFRKFLVFIVFKWLWKHMLSCVDFCRPSYFTYVLLILCIKCIFTVQLYLNIIIYCILKAGFLSWWPILVLHRYMYCGVNMPHFNKFLTVQWTEFNLYVSQNVLKNVIWRNFALVSGFLRNVFGNGNIFCVFWKLMWLIKNL